MPEPQRNSANVIVFPPLLYGATLVAGLLLQLLWPLPLFHWPPSRWIGGALAAASAILAKWGENAMRRAGTNVKPSEPTLAIVQDGPFRFSRNPLYLSLTMLYIGASLIFNALIPIVLLPFLLAVVQLGIIHREERYLEATFGDEYRNYRARVRRWF